MLVLLIPCSIRLDTLLVMMHGVMLLYDSLHDALRHLMNHLVACLTMSFLSAYQPSLPNAHSKSMQWCLICQYTVMHLFDAVMSKRVTS